MALILVFIHSNHISKWSNRITVINLDVVSTVYPFLNNIWGATEVYFSLTQAPNINCLFFCGQFMPFIFEFTFKSDYTKQYLPIHLFLSPTIYIYRPLDQTFTSWSKIKIKETHIKAGQKEHPGFKLEELETKLYFLCTNKITSFQLRVSFSFFYSQWI